MKDRLAEGRDVFLIGHSMGGILALIMAADERRSGISAIDVSGVPLRYPAEIEANFAAGVTRLHEGAQLLERRAETVDRGGSGNLYMLLSGVSA